MSLWTKTRNFHQIWSNSTEGCPLWMAIAWLPASILRQIWWLPSLNGHSSACRGAIDPGPFSTGRGFPVDDLRHWKCLKSPFQAWLIRVQSSDTKRHFWAIFGRTSSFYWFSLFSLPLSRFWPISFEPPLENPRLRPTPRIFSGGYKTQQSRMLHGWIELLENIWLSAHFTHKGNDVDYF